MRNQLQLGLNKSIEWLYGKSRKEKEKNKDLESNKCVGGERDNIILYGHVSVFKIPTSYQNMITYTLCKLVICAVLKRPTEF